MDQDDIQDLFEEKYHKLLGRSYQDWLKNAPQTEAAAYQRCMEIDKELSATYDKWFEANGEEKNKLEEYRDKLKAEYDFIEEIFGLEAQDKNW